MSADWMTTYDGVFFISLGTLLIGFLGLIVRYALKSKCEHFSCCFGAFTIDRRVDLEVQEELAQMELGVNDKEEDNIKPHESKKNLNVIMKPKHKEIKDIEENNNV